MPRGDSWGLVWCARGWRWRGLRLNAVVTVLGALASTHLVTGASEAQTAVRLVGNTGETDSREPLPFELALSALDWAQAFTTGSNVAGYKLTRVDLRMQSTSALAPVYSVSIRSESAGRPGGSLLGTLANPNSLPGSAALARFTAPGSGIDLAANTTYFIEVDISAGDEDTLLLTTWSPRESGVAGWSIADHTMYRIPGDLWRSLGGSIVMKLDVHGYARSSEGNPPGGGGAPPPPEPEPEPEPEPPPPPPVPPRAAFTVDVPCADGLCRARTGEQVTFTDTSSGTVARRSWDFYVPEGRSPSAATTRHAWSSPGFYEATLTVRGAGSESTASRVFLVEAADPAGTCEPDGETICLLDSRYQVRATWRSPESALLPARAARGGTNDSGLLWFHDAENWEVLVKVLDGCAINGADWVFAASATTLGVDIEVTDTVTGEVREYGNEAGRQADAVADTSAFADRCVDQGTRRAGSTVTGVGHHGGEGPAAVDAGIASSSFLLLQEARFEVAVEWSTADGRRGAARPVRAGTANSGLFWFFAPDNWEMLIKVLDGCGFNGHYWVYAASATDVGFDIAVTDTTTGEIRSYTKSPGAPAPALTDAAAFPDSCQLSARLVELRHGVR